MTLEFGKSGKEGIWKEGWRRKSGQDLVFLNEDQALVGIDFIDRCSFHGKDSFCRECLPRLMEVVTAAQKVIDPQVPAVAERVSKSAEDFPEYIALVNPVAKNAFAMRLQESVKMVAKKPIYTTKDPERAILGPITVVKYVNDHKVCDCSYLRGFYVRLGDSVPEEYAKKFWDARLSFLVDGEKLADRVLVRDLLSKKEILFQDPGAEDEKNCLFLACKISMEGAKSGGDVVNREDFLGYMTPNGATFEVLLEKVPGGGGLIHLEVG